MALYMSLLVQLCTRGGKVCLLDEIPELNVALVITKLSLSPAKCCLHTTTFFSGIVLAFPRFC